MKRKMLAAVSAVAAVALLLTAWLVWMKGDRSASELAGSWMLYEGGSIALDVLTFNEDGTGAAYTLSDAYQDNRMTDVQIPQNDLEHTQAFRWHADSGMLTIAYEAGETASYEMSFYTMAGVRMLDLSNGHFGGGYVPAEIID